MIDRDNLKRIKKIVPEIVIHTVADNEIFMRARKYYKEMVAEQAASKDKYS